jgi:hypothetical protein
MSVWIDRGRGGKTLLARVQKLVESFDEYLERYAEDPLFWRSQKKAKKRAMKKPTTKKRATKKRATKKQAAKKRSPKKRARK